MDKYQYHIFSPYRVCPLGAHVDHQHGLVTGFAIDKGVDLWFNVREDSLVKLSSRTFEGDVEFHVNTPSQVKERHWGIIVLYRIMTGGRVFYDCLKKMVILFATLRLIMYIMRMAISSMRTFIIVILMNWNFMQDIVMYMMRMCQGQA